MADIPIRNIFHLLSYAYRDLRQGQYTHVGSESFTHIHDLLAAIIVSATKQLLSQGLMRTYVPVHEALPTVRGRIDIAGTLTERRNQRLRMSCHHDEYSPDHLLNQILKSTLLLLLQQTDVPLQQRHNIKRVLLHLEGIATIDVRRVRWDTLVFHQHNQRYALPVTMCRLVVEGLLLQHDGHGIRMRQVLDDQSLAVLFQRFVYAYYQRHFPMLRPHAAQITWAGVSGDGSALPRMQTDIVLTDGTRTLIIDTKYYARSMQQHFSGTTLHSAHLYQLFAYVKNHDVHATGRTSGLLVYAQTATGPVPAVDIRMSGNRMAAQALDLASEWVDIAAQLDAVVGKFFA